MATKVRAKYPTFEKLDFDREFDRMKKLTPAINSTAKYAVDHYLSKTARGHTVIPPDRRVIEAGDPDVSNIYFAYTLLE